MKAGTLELEVKIDTKKALKQMKMLKWELIKINNLINQLKDIDIDVSVVSTDKKWYQFWK